MMKSDKITIYMQCIDWTCGEVAYFDIMLAKDASVRMDWGDNHCDTVMINAEKWQSMEHSYSEKARRSCEKFVISIEAEGYGQIIGLRNWSIDMHTDDIDLTQCPNLQYLTAEFMDNLNLTLIPQLKELYIKGCTMREIDLSSNTELEKIECPCSEFKVLNFSSCKNLKEVECWCCFSLTNIGVSNDSNLKRIILDRNTPITETSMRYLREVIERNEGEIILND
ncbi:MAG: hypothetical protein HUK14_11695 [Muribaculaceae bacterium]|nr:hypothetical protein [Muribaculaceae bacterium]